MESLIHEDSVVVHAPPEALYDMIADVTRMDEWSPECTACSWDEQSPPGLGSGFSGTNVDATHEWQTHCRVIAADRGREFAFVVELSTVVWRYRFEPVAAGTRLTESWMFPTTAFAVFDERFGRDAPTRIKTRTELARTGIAATLAAIKRVAEASS